MDVFKEIFNPYESMVDYDRLYNNYAVLTQEHDSQFGWLWVRAAQGFASEAEAKVWLDNKKETLNKADWEVKCILNGHILEQGDILIGVDRHSCKVKFVEGSDETCVLLVDGIKDEVFEPSEFKLLSTKYRLLVKKEDRQDLN